MSQGGGGGRGGGCSTTDINLHLHQISKQCSGSGPGRSVGWWAYWIRIRNLFHQQKKTKNHDLITFLETFYL
jgi:hypothetical protein